MSPTPGIHAIHLDLTGWQPLKEDYRWIKPGPDLLGLRYFDVPTGLPYTLDPREQGHWLQHYEAMVAPQNGAVVSVDLLPIQGLKAVRTILKYHQPVIMEGLSDLGMTFLGTWMVPLADFSFNIQVQSFEAGTTGVREATVMMMLDRNKLATANHAAPPAQRLESMEEYFEIVRNRPVTRLRADDEEFDALFPNHPLSRLRAELHRIAATIRVEDTIHRARPYRT
jgi:hypothetical protein